MKKATPITFHTTILKTGKNTAGIEVPEEIIEKLGSGKRPLVRVTIKKYTYPSAVAVMAGKYMISFSSAHQQATGVQGGDEADVTLELDTEPRTVEVPEDLTAALEAGGVTAVFDALAPSKRKEHVRQVTSAKIAETRQRRIGKIITALTVE